jgi:hypothetical protein
MLWQEEERTIRNKKRGGKERILAATWNFVHFVASIWAGKKEK